MRILSVAFSIFLGLLSQPQADEADARAARKMWSAWQCATYAELSGESQEQKRLFSLGYSEGAQFLTAVWAGTITQEEVQSIVPVGVALLLSGPSPEFVLGRIFESAMNEAFDSVVKRDARGVVLAPKDWIADEEIQGSIARGRYLNGNCELLR